MNQTVQSNRSKIRQSAKICQSELMQTELFWSDCPNGGTWWTWSVPSTYKESYITIILTSLRHPEKLTEIKHRGECNVSLTRWMMIYMVKALCGGLLQCALLDQSDWGYTCLFAHILTSEGSNILAKRSNMAQSYFRFAPYWRETSCRSAMNTKSPNFVR